MPMDKPPLPPLSLRDRLLKYFSRNEAGTAPGTAVASKTWRMQCCGRTKQMHRCKKETRFLFCRLHAVQPFLVLGAAFGLVKGAAETYKAVIPLYDGIVQPWYVGTWTFDFDRSFEEWPETVTRVMPANVKAITRDAMSTGRLELRLKEGELYNLRGQTYTEQVSASSSQAMAYGRTAFDIISTDDAEVRGKVSTSTPVKNPCANTPVDTTFVMKRENDAVYFLGPSVICATSSDATRQSVSEQQVMVRMYVTRLKKP